MGTAAEPAAGDHQNIESGVGREGIPDVARELLRGAPRHAYIVGAGRRWEFRPWFARGLRVHARRARGLRLPEALRAEFSARGCVKDARRGRKAGAWESDNEKKERAATPAIKSAAATYLQPTFERARQATLSRTGGDDLVHFRDFAP